MEKKERPNFSDERLGFCIFGEILKGNCEEHKRNPKMALLLLANNYDFDGSR
jgi:hypothetical protein